MPRTFGSPLRDFYAEGADAAIARHSDIPPADVSDYGLEAEAAWIDGYESIANEGDDDDSEA